MILSRKWLNEFVDVSDISDREFDEAMTLSGSKVETVTALNESLKNVVVGKVLSMVRHPNSDHMFICQVDVGQAEPVQIVTGAQNSVPRVRSHTANANIPRRCRGSAAPHASYPCSRTSVSESVAKVWPNRRSSARSGL